MKRLITFLVGSGLAALGPCQAMAVPTAAQQLRAEMAPHDLKLLRDELATMKSKNRWPAQQQDRYRKICLKQQAEEPSINARTCDCYLEVMMDRYRTMGDYTKDLTDTGAPPNEKTKVLFGACLAAFGT